MTRRPPFWSFRPTSAREAAEAVLANFVLHAFPSRMRVSSLAWTPTFWLGTVSWILFLLLLVSGLPLMAYYVPSTAGAYASMKDIEHVVSFGWWFRAVHRLAAHLMIVTVSLHVVRVFLTGAYKNAASAGQRREWNWLIGCAMLAATVLLSFTGYLLPWDQLAYWAVTTGTSIVSFAPIVGPGVRDLLLGGRDVGQAALLRFYLLHIVVLPVAMAALFAYHMWRIRKDGGLAVRSGENGNDPVQAIPVVAYRVAIVAVMTAVAVAVLAMMIPSPLQEAADPLVTPNPAKAPWYFLWVQELVTDTTVRFGALSVNGALIGGVLLPSGLLVLLLTWPWLDRSPASAIGLLMPRERRHQTMVFVALAAAVVLLTAVGMLRGPSWQFYWPWESGPAIPTRF